ncbi:hypothetical protein, partial [Yersinia mollaretii]|uniref:hypothetical protein n=2 Tax=Yersinia mollaretii TaxID=33060 RepID=UPI001C9880A8
KERSLPVCLAANLTVTREADNTLSRYRVNHLISSALLGHFVKLLTAPCRWMRIIGSRFRMARVYIKVFSVCWLFERKGYL